MSSASDKRPTASGYQKSVSVRIALWAVGIVVGLVVLFFLFRAVETWLPANF